MSSPSVSSPSPTKVEDDINTLNIKSESSDEEPLKSTSLARSASRDNSNTLLDLSDSALNSEDDEMSRGRYPKSRSYKGGDFRTSTSASTPKSERNDIKSEDIKMKEETVGGDIVVKNEPGRPPKLARSSSQKVLVNKSATLFDHLPDKTTEATKIFQVIRDCTYQNKNLGLSDDDAFECECLEELGKSILACVMTPSADMHS